MIIILSSGKLENGIYSEEVSNGKTLTICTVSESFSHDGSSTEIEECVIQVGTILESGAESISSCPSIIGMGNSVMRLASDDPELQGKKLSAANIDYCYVEMYV